MDARGNAAACGDDNHFVHANDELMDVVRDLCRSAGALRLAGRMAWAEALTEQCAELLAHRAHLFAGVPRDDIVAQFSAGPLWPAEQRLIRPGLH